MIYKAIYFVFPPITREWLYTTRVCLSKTVYLIKEMRVCFSVIENDETIDRMNDLLRYWFHQGIECDIDAIGSTLISILASSKRCLIFRHFYRLMIYLHCVTKRNFNKPNIWRVENILKSILFLATLNIPIKICI